MKRQYKSAIQHFIDWLIDEKKIPDNLELYNAMEEYANDVGWIKESSQQPGQLTESKVMEVLNTHLFTMQDPDLVDDIHKDLCALTPPPSVSEEKEIKTIIPMPKKAVDEIFELISNGWKITNRRGSGLELILTLSQSHPQEPGPEFELKFCDACYSMTNHLDDKCQRCERLTNGTQNKEEG